MPFTSANHPYYDLVPRDFAANVRFRKELCQAGSSDIETAEQLWCMCKRDILFYIGAFCWTIDPRNVDDHLHPVQPFIPFDHQAEIISDMSANLGRCDMLIEKSRCEGASWICIYLLEHAWHFYPMLSFMMVSRKDALVEKRGDPDALFTKIDFLHEKLPGFLMPNIHRSQRHLGNEDNGSAIDGESTGKQSGVGGRRTAFLLDEFALIPEDEEILAATRDNTNCRIFNSTPCKYRGVNCAFYRLTKTKIKKYKLHWSDNPTKNAGMYVDERGKARSPWYDLQVERALNTSEIATQLDIDYENATALVFDTTMLERVKKSCKQAVIHGDLMFDADTAKMARWLPMSNGSVRMWELPPESGWGSDRQFAMGVDVSQGTGASNSAASVIDRQTGIKVAEMVRHDEMPHEWAMRCAALGYWFNHAYITWEANGPGRVFGKVMININYANFYYNKMETKIGAARTNIPGWSSTKDNKQLLLRDYSYALSKGQMVNYSAEAIDECRQYVYTQTGTIANSDALDPMDPSGARENHGDRVIADALAWKGVQDRPYNEAEVPTEPPVGSYMWRRNKRAEARRIQNVWVRQ